MENQDRKQAQDFSPSRSYSLLAVCILVTIFASYFLYQNTSWFFEWSLKNRVKAIVSTAAVQFEPNVLNKIQGLEDSETPEYREVVLQLQKIRNQNQNVKYAYIQRKTEDPDTLMFVADADALHPKNPIDLNANGIIDEEEELSEPGELYDVSDYPEFVIVAFADTYVDEELSQDQWGTHLSATSPINSEYLIGIDVDVSDYEAIKNIIYVPFLCFVGFLLLMLCSLTYSLVRMWASRVRFLNELDRQKDELISMVSHQLATPITSIKWYVEMMLDGDLGTLSKDQEEHIKSMKSISEDLSDLVSMILDVSRVQLGRIKIEKQSLNLNEFFKEIEEVISPRALQKNVKLIVDKPNNLPVANLDKRYTRMTIENLLSNAIKYTPKDGEVVFKSEIKDGTLYCYVKDTGCGIPKADQSKIFGKLYRASNVRNSVDGNGFGLYVAKGAVEAQGGRIYFESEEGKGTTFYVELPLT